jgi:plasmid stabilization system protein ParE
MKVTWGRRARRDLRKLVTYIADDSVQAAEKVAARILKAAESLARTLRSGRPGRVAGTRERIVGNPLHSCLPSRFRLGPHPPRLSRSAKMARELLILYFSSGTLSLTFLVVVCIPNRRSFDCVWCKKQHQTPLRMTALFV